MNETKNIADIKIWNTRYTLVSVWDGNTQIFCGHVCKKLKNSMRLYGMSPIGMMEEFKLFGTKQGYTYTYE